MGGLIWRDLFSFYSVRKKKKGKGFDKSLCELPVEPCPLWRTKGGAKSSKEIKLPACRTRRAREAYRLRVRESTASFETMLSMRVRQQTQPHLEQQKDHRLREQIQVTLEHDAEQEFLRQHTTLEIRPKDFHFSTSSS